jgi:hypothetical protein
MLRQPRGGQRAHFRGCVSPRDLPELLIDMRVATQPSQFVSGGRVWPLKPSSLARYLPRPGSLLDRGYVTQPRFVDLKPSGQNVQTFSNRSATVVLNWQHMVLCSCLQTSLQHFWMLLGLLRSVGVERLSCWGPWVRQRLLGTVCC